MSPALDDAITPDVVTEWMRLATRDPRETVPSHLSPHVVQLASYIARQRAQYSVQLSAKQVAGLIEFEKSFSRFFRLAQDLSKEANNLLKLCDPDDIETRDQVWRTIAHLDRQWLETSITPEFWTRSIWHIWAWNIRTLACEAWDEVGLDRRPINQNNPMARFLQKSLAAIDGTERNLDTIEKALIRLKDKSDESIITNLYD